MEHEFNQVEPDLNSKITAVSEFSLTQVGSGTQKFGSRLLFYGYKIQKMYMFRKLFKVYIIIILYNIHMHEQTSYASQIQLTDIQTQAQPAEFHWTDALKISFIH